MKMCLLGVLMGFSVMVLGQEVTAKDTVVAGMKWTCLIREDFPGQIKSISSSGRFLSRNSKNVFEYIRTASAAGKPENGVYTNKVIFVVEYNDEEEKSNTITTGFKVRKPRLVLKTGVNTSVSSLKLNQENEIFITCPDIDPFFKPYFRVVKGSCMISGTDGRGRLVLVPNTVGKVSISVSSGGRLIGTLSFLVK